jgi:uncharacterized protein
MGDEGRIGPVAATASAFGRALRQSGLEAPVSSVALFAEALGVVGLSSPGPVYWAGRAVFVRRPEDVPGYAQTFAAFWSGTAPEPQRVVAAPNVEVPALLGGEDEADDDRDEPAPETALARYSAVETLRRKDFAACSEEELAEAYRLMSLLRGRTARRRSRRLRPSRSTRGVLDVRRTVRRALRSEGETLRLSRLVAAERPRRLILLVDVSGSMEAYARALLRFAHAAVVGRGQAGHGKVEAFTLGTRLTRVTRQLAWRDPDAALARASGSVEDIAGGTRLGAALRQFNDRFGIAGMARGSVVVVLSDGWDRGDPALLAGEMARLARVAHRIVWVNPLKATAGYEPLARGMAAALPYVDEFVEGHSIESLAALVEVMAR